MELNRLKSGCYFIRSDLAGESASAKMEINRFPLYVIIINAYIAFLKVFNLPYNFSIISLFNLIILPWSVREDVKRLDLLSTYYLYCAV